MRLIDECTKGADREKGGNLQNKKAPTALEWVFYCARDLSTGLLLLATEEGAQADTGHLHDLETDAGNISHGVTLTTETSDENLVLMGERVNKEMSTRQ